VDADKKLGEKSEEFPKRGVENSDDPPRLELEAGGKEVVEE